MVYKPSDDKDTPDFAAIEWLRSHGFHKAADALYLLQKGEPIPYVRDDPKHTHKLDVHGVCTICHWNTLAESETEFLARRNGTDS